MLDKSCPIGRFQLGNLEGSGKNHHAKSANLERVIKLEPSSEELELHLFGLDRTQRRKQYQPEADDGAEIKSQREQMKPGIQHGEGGISPSLAGTSSCLAFPGRRTIR